MRCAIYVRVSSEDQAKGDRFSLPTQEESCRRYIAEQGWVFDERHFYREAHTGTELLDRPELTRMRRAMGRHEFDVIVVHAYDRLSRVNRHVGWLMTEADNAGVSIRSATQDFDPDTVEGTVMMGVTGTFSEVERKNLLERTGRGRVGRVKGGEVSGSVPAPYGYVYADKRKSHFIPKEDEAPIVDFIFTSAAEGSSITAIAKALDNRRVPTPKGGKTWSQNTIINILNNRVYLGEYYSRRYSYIKDRVTRKRKRIENPRNEWIPIPNGAPRLVSQEVWDAAHAKIKRQKKWQRAEAGKDFGTLLTLPQQVRCGVCGQAMGRAWANTRRVDAKTGEVWWEKYASYKHYAKPGTDCPFTQRKAERIDGEVWEALCAHVKNRQAAREFMESRRQENALEADLKSLAQHLIKLRAEHEAQQDNLLEVLPMLNATNRERMVAKLNAQADEIAQLEAEYAIYQQRAAQWEREQIDLDEVDELLAFFDEGLDEMSLDQRRLLVQAFDVQVLIYPTRHEIEWEAKGCIFPNVSVLLASNQGIAPTDGSSLEVVTAGDTRTLESGNATSTTSTSQRSRLLEKARNGGDFGIMRFSVTSRHPTQPTYEVQLAA